MTNHGAFIYFRMDLASGPDETGVPHIVYLDTDGNPSTGFPIGNIGADYKIECYEIPLETSSVLFKWVGSWSAIVGRAYAVNH